MNLPDINAQLEAELTWRQDEMRLLKNQLAYISKEEDRLRYRKALVVMLYSHYEGFCKIAFLIYVSAINQEKLSCTRVNDYLITASFAEIFKALEIPDSKCKVFKPKLPEDVKLHRFCRQVNFISELDNFLNKQIEIPEEVIDTESNLKREVMRKILFRLGFSYTIFESQEHKIKDLLEIRNNIAHGKYMRGIDQNIYEALEKSSYEIMSELKELLTQSLSCQSYLRV